MERTLLDRLKTRKQLKLSGLLASIFTYVFILPLFAHPIVLLINLALVVTILYSAAIVLGDKRYIFLMVIGVVIAIEIFTSFRELHYLNILSRCITLLMFLYIVYRLIKEILRKEEVTAGTILEAINGYLLLGIAFSGLTRVLSDLIPTAYNTPQTDNDSLYFAFVTMTTLGYGDILPIHPIAKSLTMIISIAGQFYVGVIVAILVGKYANRQIK